MADVIRLSTKTAIESGDADATTYGDRSNGKSKVTVSNETIGPFSESLISPRDLYPLHAERMLLSTALQLLDEGMNYLNDSIGMFDDGDRLGSDDALQHFQALLPELFSCRELGDGFGAIVSSVFHSLKNLDGGPLSGKQLQTLRQIVRRISTEPYISFDEALDELEVLQDAGLEVQPPYFKFAADLLSE